MANFPQTNKQLLVWNNQGAQIQNVKYLHTNTSANHTETYTNTNQYAIIVLVSAQAGSGEINNNYSESQLQRTYNAGNRGHNLLILLGNRAIVSLSGGEGSQGGAIKGGRNRSWSLRRGGWYYTAWSDYANSKQIAQNGQSASFIITIPPNQTLQFRYVSNNANGSTHKGSHSISVIY